MLPFILSFIIFLVICGVTASIVLSTQREKRSRLMKVVRGSNALETKSNKGNAQDQRRSDLAKKLVDENKKVKDKKTISIKDKLQQAGLETSVQKFWLYSVISCIFVMGLAKFMGVSPFVFVMSFFIGLFGLPRFILKLKINKRMKQFMDDFPDALEAMMRLLQAGMPVSEAIKMVGREFDGPMGEEMERIFDQQKIGVPLPEAVLASSKRVPLTEMQMFATAIAIQTQTGSSLSEVLQNLATVIRSRFKLQRKVKALSSEAKASAMIIGALPIVVALGMYFINRPYIEVLFTTDQGKFLLGLAIGWMCVGVLVMRQMINFKV